MPTYSQTSAFLRDYTRLTPDQQRRFRTAVAHFIHDLRRGQFRKGLRIKLYHSEQDLWEMTWAPDGRALFSYGESIHAGERHIIWQRVGSHDIFE